MFDFSEFVLKLDTLPSYVGEIVGCEAAKWCCGAAEEINDCWAYWIGAATLGYAAYVCSFVGFLNIIM